MKCQVCDCFLIDEESCQRDEKGQYLDICYKCSSNLYEDLDYAINDKLINRDSGDFMEYDNIDNVNDWRYGG